ncbi:MAG: aminomethyl-transferring glycine dehydrogenase subunit GcvPA [Planctomycetes bacterium]|nr:aminomethyl-transferring glycine dehydrogenase subunit GcvPA [Planctomycetota bacterium]
MKYTQTSDTDVKRMLQTIGVKSIDELFSTVPESLRLGRDLDIPEGVSELELLRDVNALGKRNHDCDELTCFLGGGAYDHFIPTLVDALSGQSEFLTAYTPYQAEASQGMLQLFYEFQTMVASLLGMDVANASLYEGATAAAEAVMMAIAITRRKRAVISASVHPDTIRVLQSYGRSRGIEVIVVAAEEGTTDEVGLAQAVDETTAAVVLQSPNFFGCVERVDRMIPGVRDRGALAIVATDPIACGLLKPPGDFDADIVVAEGQPLGIPMQYGGPYLGLLACKEKYLRKMPGRVVGMTHDTEGRRAFCLALQTREQHIKRERATSNICTNQGLLAIRASIYLASMGKRGMAEVASLCFEKAHYAAKRIAEIDGYDLRFDAPFFKEFVVRASRGVRKVLESCRDRGILAGVPLVRFDDRYSDCFLVAVTEKRTKEEIDQLVDVLAAV